MTYDYIYDINTNNIYSEEDLQLITDSPDDVDDYGQISEVSSLIFEQRDDWWLITLNQSIFVFGSILFDQINNIAKYRVPLPVISYKPGGQFNIISGFSPPEPYPWIEGPGVGKSWSFSRASYKSSGIVAISGISSTRKISVYGYYGEDRNPGTSGTITISQQTSPTLEKKINSYVGFGGILVFAPGPSTYTIKYNGSGIISLSGTLIESHSKEVVGLSLGNLTLSGASLQSYIIKVETNPILFNFSGVAGTRQNNNYIGKTPDKLSLTGTANVNFSSSYSPSALLRFVRHDVDNNYDTCDQEEITSDNQDSANVNFVANPVENTVLFEFGGNASTREIATYEYSSYASYNLSGSYQDLKVTHTEPAGGTLFTISSSIEKEVDAYIGSGSLFNVSGAFASHSIQTIESTLVVNIFGSAITRIESVYTNVGIGLGVLTGFADTRKISNYTAYGFGSILLSGELIYPNVVFIPSPDGFGNINILGSSNNLFVKSYINTFGTLFALSSGLESLSKSTYTGIGTIYVQEISGIQIFNSFEIPRTYVCII